jgi:hypothetical protein
MASDSTYIVFMVQASPLRPARPVAPHSRAEGRHALAGRLGDTVLAHEPAARMEVWVVGWVWVGGGLGEGPEQFVPEGRRMGGLNLKGG